MELRERISAGLKASMKNKEAERTSTLRLINAAIKDRDIAVRGDAEDLLADQPAVEVESELRDRLAASRVMDQDRGRAHIGAHKADLEVSHLEQQMPAALCSTGEQKALLVSIILADARLQATQQGTPPIMLLDEIAAHFDDDHRAALVDEIIALGAQAWLTGTDRGLFGALEGRATFLTVADGKVNPAHE